MTWTRAAIILFLLFTFGFAFASRAQAYLDPGTGSYFCQLMLAGILGAIFVIKLNWARIRMSIAKFFSKER